MVLNRTEMCPSACEKKYTLIGSDFFWGGGRRSKNVTLNSEKCLINSLVLPNFSSEKLT